MHKVALAMLLEVCSPAIEECRSEHQFVFRRGFQTSEANYILRDLVETQWGYRQDVMVLGGGARKFYVDIRHGLLASRLLAKGLPISCIAFWVRETRASLADM